MRFIDPDGRMTADEVMAWYRRQESSNFGDAASGELGASGNCAPSESHYENNAGPEAPQTDQKSNNSVVYDSDQDPYDFHDPINDPLIGVKAMSGLFELTGLVGLYQGFRKGVIMTVKWAAKKVGYKVANKTAYNFTKTAGAHMNEAARMIPLQTMDEIIKSPIAVLKDPAGSTDALMHYA